MFQRDPRLQNPDKLPPMALKELVGIVIIYSIIYEKSWRIGGRKKSFEDRHTLRFPKSGTSRVTVKGVLPEPLIKSNLFPRM